ncbi:MAG: hypothetical protein ACRDLV_16280, partial [Solirubrobacteraceae bacterium]
MGRRERQRRRAGESGTGPDRVAERAPTSEYRDGDDVLVLRGSLSPATRREYASTLAGGSHREDARQRAIELLFERL